MTQSNPAIEDKSCLLEFLPKPEAPFTFEDLQHCLSSLHLIAQNLRSHRIENGAVSLEKLELNFNFPKPLSVMEKCTNECSTTRWPQGFSVKVRNPAHHLIEEWMIVANQSVARFLFGNFIKRLKRCETF
uniref:RNB domain-containing protein n=1 Tax=Schistosoma mansoni TaxID=6183 RepID=A0A146MGJ8_SCHMA